MHDFKHMGQSLMKNHTLFISDVHLRPSHKELTNRFAYFIQHQADQADALYILGDFFHRWIGDDDHNPFHDYIISLLKKISSNIPVYFMHGNHDFIIGNQFAKSTGITLIPDPSIIQLYDQKILLTHGDSLCTLDKKHQFYRKLYRNKGIKKILMLTPLRFRQNIAVNLRKKSITRTRDLPMHILDVKPESVVNLMKKFKTNILIHGHTHRPNIHEITIDNKIAHRIVLGDWHRQGNYLIFQDNGSYELRHF